MRLHFTYTCLGKIKSSIIQVLTKNVSPRKLYCIICDINAHNLAVLINVYLYPHTYLNAWLFFK